MGEDVFEMEYFINGEKYVITATKVLENVVEEPTNEVEFSDEMPDLSDVDTVMFMSVSDIPEGISLCDWIDLIREYNVILTK